MSTPEFKPDFMSPEQIESLEKNLRMLSERGTDENIEKLNTMGQEYLRSRLRAAHAFHRMLPQVRPKPWYRRLVRTWVVEAFVVALALGITTEMTGGKPVEWVGAAAVFFSFLHAQVGFRFTEAADEQATNKHEVECYHWMTRYFLAKEVLWCIYFITLGAWSGLVGVGIFLSYPVWRKYYRS